jgi:hypothetical protein
MQNRSRINARLPGPRGLRPDLLAPECLTYVLRRIVTQQLSICNLGSRHKIHSDESVREVLGVRDVVGLLGYPSSPKTRLPPDMTTSSCTADVSVRLHLHSTFECSQRPDVAYASYT